MERGKEVVFEYAPEPSAVSRTGLGAKGGAAASRVAASSMPARENENIDGSSVSTRSALNIFLKKEAENAEIEKEAAKTEAQRQWQMAQDAVALPPSLVLGERAETMDQRCARLQVECLELLRCCESSSMGDALARAELMGANPDELSRELRAFEKQLRVWRKGATASATDQAAVVPSGSGGPGSMSETLASQLDRLAAGGDKDAKSSGQEGMVSWEVNYAPSTVPIIESSQIATLESTLASMENKLGVTGAKDQDLYNQMVTLHRRMGMMDAAKLESVQTILGKAKAGLIEASQAQDSVPMRNGNIDRKVKELYDACHRFTPVAANLPAIVTRMKSLESLHQMSASFTARLSVVEHEQEELMKIVEVTNVAIQEMNRGLHENMAILKDNMEQLEHKLTKH